MKKRLLSGLLAAVLVLGLAPAALAAAPAEDEAAQVLAALDIMVGDSDGNLELGRAVTRAEFTKMAVAASTSRDAVGDTVPVKPYPDVPQTYWAAPWIKAAVDQGLVKGNLHGYFEPNRTITLAEGVTIALRLLGYHKGVLPFGAGDGRFFWSTSSRTVLSTTLEHAFTNCISIRVPVIRAAPLAMSLTLSNSSFT